MKFWYKLGAKPRGHWNRPLEFGGQITTEERELHPDLAVHVKCTAKHTNSPAPETYQNSTAFLGAPVLDREGRWSQGRIIYFDPADAADAIIFAIAIRDALLERIAQARAIEPEPAIAEEFDSDKPALPADAPVRRIRLVS